MQQTTCTRCGYRVTVSPEHFHCPQCGEDLAEAVTPATVSQYFYERAARLAEAERWEEALAETQTGLEAVHTSELLLLAALLAQRLGRFNLMRRYIAQIPVGDPLREEGEWLLRSHQARQRLQREKAQLLRSGAADADSLTTEEFAAIGSPVPEEASGRSQTRFWPALVTMLLIFATAWVMWDWLSGPVEPADPSTADILTTENSLQMSPGDTATPVFQALTATVEPVLGAPAETPSFDGEVQEDPVEPTAAPTSTPAGDVPDNVVQQQNQPTQSIAASDEEIAARAASSPFDILAFLRNAGRPDLAELSIDAQLQDGTLAIFGAVPWTSQRLEILELAETIPEADEINDNNLVVRQPETYTVQEGDTLWIIAYRLFGDGNRWREIQAANSALLPSPESLDANMQLAVPPAQ